MSQSDVADVCVTWSRRKFPLTRDEVVNGQIRRESVIVRCSWNGKFCSEGAVEERWINCQGFSIMADVLQESGLTGCHFDMWVCLCPFPDCELCKFLGGSVSGFIITSVDGKLLRDRIPVFNRMAVR